MCYIHPVPDFRSVHVTRVCRRGDTFEMLGSVDALPNAAKKHLNSAPKSSTRQTASKPAPLLA